MIFNIAVTLFCVILVHLADRFGDSSKPTAWMFFLGPIGLFGLVIFWAIRLFCYFL
jgi:hypothetical protein